MSTDPEVMQLLGRIDGKLDSVTKSLERHIDDDVRRFGELYKKTGEHDQEIAQAKGAKGAILWIVGGGAAAISTLIAMFIKAKGG